MATVCASLSKQGFWREGGPPGTSSLWLPAPAHYWLAHYAGPLAPLPVYADLLATQKPAAAALAHALPNRATSLKAPAPKHSLGAIRAPQNAAKVSSWPAVGV